GFLLLSSCYYDSRDAEDIPDVPEPDNVSFSEDVQPILNQCTQCHDGAFADPDMREGNSYNALVPAYVEAGNAEGSLLYQRLPGNGQHPIDAGFVLSAEEIATIKGWINQGAENN
ncbi:MAG: hypothetical protein ACO3AE_13400, partial [Robiginitalea sp.]